MRFGKTLQESVYPPWKDKYIDYAKLKSMLREDPSSREDERPWTEDDEQKFSDEMLNVQLEKVATFQELTFKSLEQRGYKTGETLRDLTPVEGASRGDITTARLKELEQELDGLIKETTELKKYSSVNYTGFLKIVKKHDRKRGNNYKIRPMLQLSLSKRPFNSEQAYSSLLLKLCNFYYAVRQHLDEPTDPGVAASSDVQSLTVNGEKYRAYKCRLFTSV